MGRHDHPCAICRRSFADCPHSLADIEVHRTTTFTIAAIDARLVQLGVVSSTHPMVAATRRAVEKLRRTRP